jgi:hypothetical protein
MLYGSVYYAWSMKYVSALSVYDDGARPLGATPRIIMYDDHIRYVLLCIIIMYNIVSFVNSIYAIASTEYSFPFLFLPSRCAFGAAFLLRRSLLSQARKRHYPHKITYYT